MLGVGVEPVPQVGPAGAAFLRLAERERQLPVLLREHDKIAPLE